MFSQASALLNVDILDAEHVGRVFAIKVQLCAVAIATPNARALLLTCLACPPRIGVLPLACLGHPRIPARLLAKGRLSKQTSGKVCAIPTGGGTSESTSGSTSGNGGIRNWGLLGDWGGLLWGDPELGIIGGLGGIIGGLGWGIIGGSGTGGAGGIIVGDWGGGD